MYDENLTPSSQSILGTHVRYLSLPSLKWYGFLLSSALEYYLCCLVSYFSIPIVVPHPTLSPPFRLYEAESAHVEPHRASLTRSGASVRRSRPKPTRPYETYILLTPAKYSGRDLERLTVHIFPFDPQYLRGRSLSSHRFFIITRLTTNDSHLRACSAALPESDIGFLFSLFLLPSLSWSRLDAPVTVSRP